MHERGEINIGQLARENFGGDTFLLGFSTFQGYVTAANDWDMPAQHMAINPGSPGSFEELFHHVKHRSFFLDLCNKTLEHYLHIPFLQRAIGVIYRPDTERYSHYFFSRLPDQFDGIIHIDETTAVEPIDVNVEWQKPGLLTEKNRE